jgi:ketosteroid isomerase-like protein
MKTLLYVLSAACLLAAYQQSEVASAEKALDEALRNRDAAALDRLHADDYIHIHPSGVITTKQQALAAVKQCQIPSYEWVEPPLIRIYGDAAVVTGRRHANQPGVTVS